MADAKTFKSKVRNKSDGSRFVNTTSGQVTIRPGTTSDTLEMLEAEKADLEAYGLELVSSTKAKAAAADGDKPLDKQTVDELHATAKAESVEVAQDATKAELVAAIQAKRDESK